MQLLRLTISVSFLIITITLCQIPRCFCSVGEKYYTDCSSSFDCGNLKNLSYPFWGPNRPAYCGHPDFKLSCSGEVAEITIMFESFRVLEVNNSDYSLRVVRTDFWNNACPTLIMNNTIYCTLFDYGSDSYNLTLFYDCPSSLPLSLSDSDVPSTQFNCSINGTEMIDYFMTGDMLESADEIMGTCKSTVIVPILESHVKVLEANLTVENLKAVIDNGFGLKWKANNSQCYDCQKSGGHCGYDLSSEGFTCFCRDGSFPSTCRSMVIQYPYPHHSLLLEGGYLYKSHRLTWSV
ncbi:LEAF RUST 10 DISEASE-RESISTANCE LOCUS RECEPTOR-LIKE PROTEIN KINASE-like 1.4 isoform X1 [Senna tora]|uniref:non-specific serine/threonine protein kinase n=1 Tax=Senna tora TaxID=362788 RepID=A0A834SXZ8_9FABA|nr:LEAF RUST 10 DISEASE-RESISTANCE LOCUS RECEPTOR-LIKE PROTEIN KINASE-like 1.4 isoform X1 [Senna tora]